MTTLESITRITRILILVLTLSAAPIVLTGGKCGGKGKGVGKGQGDGHGGAVSILKASYDASDHTVLVYATLANSSRDHDMTVAIDGFVTGAPMKFDSYQRRYRYEARTKMNLNGVEVTVTAGNRQSRTVAIQ